MVENTKFRSSYNFAFIDESTKKEVRRKILKAVCIPGYQVPYSSPEMPISRGWGTGGLHLTLSLIGPTVELVARDDLHPALSDLLIRAAREIHGSPGLYRNAGEYPAPLARDFPISPDAERYYKSGEQFLYKRLPFWLASLVDRLLVVLLPLLVVIIPATRVAPALYRWRVRSRIYRWYGALMAIEHDIHDQQTPEQRAAVFGRLDEITVAVKELRTPLSFADQVYVLRDHVGNVRRRLQSGGATAL